MMVVALNNLTPEQARTYSLVLWSIGIEHELTGSHHDQTLWVHALDMDTALINIQAYIEENSDESVPSSPEETGLHPSVSGVWGAVFLFVWHMAFAVNGDPNAFVSMCGSVADRILAGEWYRCVTSLFIHADALHLIGNMVGIAVMGSAVCAFAGWGMGWLLILLTGFSGNLLNAVCYQTAHNSIGASTAVFGALGLVCAHQFVKEIRRSGFGFRALVPFSAGLALLGFMSSGIRVDITAHLLGFLCGGLTGGVLEWKMSRPLPTGFQCICLITCFLIILAAWVNVPGI